MSDRETASIEPTLPPLDTSSVDPNARKAMAKNRRRDTGPELVVRKLLRKIGFPGYRLDWKKAPGHPDIAYPGRKIATFVHGCFWHRCPVCKKKVPQKNRPYWLAKFERNVRRDERVKAELEKLGWKVIVIWEHQLKKDEIEATERYLYEVISLSE